HGGDVCRAQPLDRRALRPDRSAREDRGMSSPSSGNWPSAVRQTRSTPSPTRPGLARVASFLAQVGQARRALGEGWGGGSLLLPETRQPTSTPTPDLSPQGGGEATELVATPRAIPAGIRTAPALAHNTGFSAALRHARYILGENAVTA